MKKTQRGEKIKNPHQRKKNDKNLTKSEDKLVLAAKDVMRERKGNFETDKYMKIYN